MNKMLSIGTVLVCLAALLSTLCTAEEPAFTWANPAAVAEVASGTRTEANAAWWGFNAEDVTDSLQAAINSGAKRLVVPYTGQEWIVQPINLAGNQEVVFEPGVVIHAKKGEFHKGGDSLFTARGVKDLSLVGYGATFKMNKPDYQSKEYSKAEWRMTLDITSCTNVTVAGLRMESSGGDGIYLGSKDSAHPYNENITIRDVVCLDHHRQGISVISAVNLLIENCVFSGTKGTAPQAGIDLEPNGPQERLANCVIRRCQFDNNAGGGMDVYLGAMKGGNPEPISILFEDCVARGNGEEGMVVGALQPDGPKGTIEFKNCTAEATRRPAVQVYDKAAEGASVKFTYCSFKGGTDDKGREAAPIILGIRRTKDPVSFAGVEFEDCHVYASTDQPAVRIIRRQDDQALTGVKGTLYVHNAHEPMMDVPENLAFPDLKLVRAE
jgi:polygalacturonase